MPTKQQPKPVPGQYLPLSIARMLWNRRKLTVVATLALTAAGVLYVHNLPKIYHSDAVILVDAQKIPEKFVTSTVQVSLPDSLNSISQQVLSSDQLVSIINEMGLYKAERKGKSADDVLDMMRADLTIKVERGFAEGKAGAFRISYEGPDAEADAKVVSRVANLFIRENYRSRERRAQGTTDFLDEQLVGAKKSLDKQEASLGEFKSKFVGELPQQESSLLSTVSVMQSQLQANEEAVNRVQQSRTVTETSLRLAESAKSTLERSLAQQRDAAAALAATPNTVLSPDGTVKPEPLASEKLRADLDSLRVRYYDGHPEVKRVQAELAQALAAEARAAATRQAQVAAHPVSATAEVVRPLPQTAESAALTAELKNETERAATARAQLQTQDLELKSRAADRMRMQAELSKTQHRIESLPIREQQMASLMRDYETSKLNYQSLLDKKNSAEMASDMEKNNQSEGFTIADQPRVSNVPVKPRKEILYPTVAVLSLLLALLLGLGLELRKDTFLGEWELPSSIPVLGRIPQVLGEKA